MRVTVFLSVLLASGSLALAQTNLPSNVRELSLRECINLALEQNFDIQISYYTPEMTRFRLAAAYGAYDPTFRLSGQHDYSRERQYDPYSGSTESESDSFGAGLSGLLPWGLSYNLGGNISDNTREQHAWTGTNWSFFSTNSDSGSAGALELRQPLLKNFWIDDARLTIRNLKKEVKKNVTDYADTVMWTVTSVESAYFKLAYAEENVKVRETALELAQRLVAENKKKVEVGAMAPLDEKQAESQAASSKASLIEALGIRDAALRVLKDLLSNDYTNTWANVVIKPTDRLVALPQQFDLQASWRKGLANGPRYYLIQTRLSIEQKNEVIRQRQNQLYPQLDAIGSFMVSGADRNSSGALRQMRDQDNPSWYFGAEMSIPLGRTSARNNLKESRADKEQALLMLKQAEQKTLIQIENDIANAVTYFERVDATRQARRYAEAALEAEQKKLDNGKSTSFIVLQLQRDLTDARSQEISALAEYNIALATLAYDEGSTLERRNISMDLK